MKLVLLLGFITKKLRSFITNSSRLMKVHALWAVTSVVWQVFLNGVTLKVKELRWFEVSGATRSVTSHLQPGRSNNLMLVMSADAVQAINRSLLENKYNVDTKFFLFKPMMYLYRLY